MKRLNTKNAITLTLLFHSLLLIAQDFSTIATGYLNDHQEKYNFNIQDIAELKVSSSSYSQSLKAHTVYMTQYYEGIEVHNSSSVFVINNNQVLHTSLSFQKNISSRINSTTAGINALQAIEQAASAHNLNYSGSLEPITSSVDNALQFTNESLSRKAITVTPIYFETEESLTLSWEVYLETIDHHHMYLFYVDALTGELLQVKDLVLTCNFSEEERFATVHDHKDNRFSFQKAAAQNATTLMSNPQYNVYKIPIESPNHGNETIVMNPSDPVASPYGWHDTDGATGFEFSITRGNNVYAQEDFDGNDGTLGTAPDGGATLDFSFPQQLNIPAQDNVDGATVNLFYMNNIMHDVWYHYGFDEASGNFQANNYANGGLEGDFVVADAQDGSGFNNATFGTPGDGGNPRMNMFLWSAPTSGGADPVTINNGPLAGSYNGIPAGFGPSLPNPSTPLNGDLELVVDDNSGGSSNDSTDACDVITNGAVINGKIAVVRRGNCQFGTKVLAMENQGAIAVIVINNVNTPIITMGPGNDGGFVTIPAIMISQADGNALISQLQAGAIINADLNNSGLFRKDGSLDNGIVAHEYGHGISTRLTGGPANPACLINEEQMGEGWSDWVALMLTIEPGDQGTDVRGIGTYAINQSTAGGGIRNFPYSTNLSVNPVSFGDTNNTNFTVPHGVGSIWASILWDLSWRFIDDYGFDPDLYNGTGGNNIVMQLVMDGLKLQPCNPGFVDGRDAILQADMIANGGLNQDRIWEVFANRGLGYSASSGSVDSRFDQIEAFDTPPPLNITSLNSSRFTIYPNPTSGIISIVSEQGVKSASLTVHDLNGRLVFTHKSNFDTIEKINLSALNSGIYVLNIKGEGTNYISKIVID
ncbi:T9SS-dependent M36 family metallopeptidase [Nonlabens sp.]|uniref:T9SS-dependent M36 family metallopeptidase n=1 Tax=Nonlabens sp. TaxID=1888209 RepID=UPI003F69A7F0